MAPLGIGDWSFNTFLMCFAGGILGTTLGGLYAFVICGLLVLLGCISVLGGGSDFLLLNVGLGPIFGPHVGGFASGVAAVSYAIEIKKNLANPALSLGSKDILSPLIDTSWDVYLVGGVFAVFGHAVFNILLMIPIVNKFDCIALTVVISAMVARLIFHKGEPPWGRKESIKDCGYFGYACQWLPWMNVPSKQIVFGFGVGIFSASLAMWAKGLLAPMVEAKTVTELAAFIVPIILSWSIAAVSLIALQLGTLSVEAQGEIQKVPAWHCQSILAAVAYMHFGSLLLAGVVGILAMFLQDFGARLFWNHGSNHWDPPATGIAFGTFILNMIKQVVDKA